MKKKYLKNKYLIIFLIFLIISLLLLNLSIKKGNNYKINPTNIIFQITSPLQKGIYKISTDISNWFSFNFNNVKFQKENKKLKIEISNLRKQLVEFNKYKAQNQELLKLLNINESKTNINFEPALVIGKISNDPFKSFIIDKGSSDNIKPHSCVITPSGIVGYISKVMPNTSVVKTILDKDIAIGIYNSNNGESGVLTGSMELAYKNLSKMKYLPRKSSAKSKDILITSGIGNNFPKGILVGEILTLKQETHSTSCFGVVKPFCDFDHLQNVFIIKSFSKKTVTYSNINFGQSSNINFGISGKQ